MLLLFFQNFKKKLFKEQKPEKIREKKNLQSFCVYAQVVPIYLYLIFEMSSSRTRFLNLIFKLDFLSISNLIFTACLGCKNPVQNLQKIQLKNHVQKSHLQTRYFKSKVQIDRAVD